MDTGPVVVTQSFNCSKEALWNGITRPEEMRQWFFESIPAFEAATGFRTQFQISSESRSFTCIWKVIKVDVEKMYRLEWTYKEYPGLGIVTFELDENKDGQVLTVSNLGLETYPQDIPEFKRESCLAGWQYFINQRLKDYLDQ